MNNLSLAIKATKISAAILKEHFIEPRVSVKGVKDVVTTADVEAENAIKEFLLGKTDYGFLGEETGKKKGNPVWIVDPIDGTRPFCFGIPNFSTIIALMDGSDTMLGVVYNPITKEMYTSEKDRGAFLNGKRIRCKNGRMLKDALVACAFVYGRKELTNLAKSVNVCLINLSCALDVCRVAEGRIDAAVYGLTKIYDHAAPALIAKEAGAIVTNFGTDTWNPFIHGIIASKPNIRRDLSRMFPRPLGNLDSNERSWVNK